MSLGIRRFILLLGFGCSLASGMNLCERIQMFAAIQEKFTALRRTLPFQAIPRDGVASMSNVEARYVKEALIALRDFALAAARPITPHEDRNTYYSQFARPPKAGETIQESPNGTGFSGDTRMLVNFPGSESIWQTLSAPGRLALTRGIAALYSRGKYEERDHTESPVHEPGIGFSALRLAGAAARKMECGECRLAAASVASLLGELGATAHEVRLAENAEHVWVEARMEKNGEWWVVDGTAGGPALVAPLSRSGEEYNGAVSLHPLFLQPDSGNQRYTLQLIRRAGEITGMRYTLGHHEREAAHLIDEHADSLRSLDFSIPTGAELSAGLAGPDLAKVLSVPYRKVSLNPEINGPDFFDRTWTVQETQTVLDRFAQSPSRNTLEDLTLYDLPADRAVYDRIATDFSKVTSLEITGDFPALAQSKLFSRLHVLEYSLVNEAKLGQVLTALETQPNLQMKRVNFGGLSGISSALQARVKAYQAQHPAVELDVRFLGP